MSEPKLISPMLDNFVMGDPISDHNGVRCCPAMEKDTDNKYIVKIISTPATQTQLDALLLSGAYPDKDAALSYFKLLSESITQEAEILQKLSQLEGFVPFEKWQIEPMTDAVGYDVYLLSPYKRTLQQYIRRNTMTHLGALNLGLDLCAALAVCRRSGYLYADLKPTNIYITADHEYRIGDIGFLKLDSLRYTSLPDRYRSQYTAPEIADAFSALNTTIDVYAVGLILYQVFNDGNLPFKEDTAPAEAFPAPAYADYEMAEIILKACAPDPAMRWQDPIEMGQAIVSYMQRNGAHDAPIVPVPVSEESDIAQEDAEISVEEDTCTEVQTENEGDFAQNTEEAAASLVDEEPSAEEITEALIYSEDENGNLTFLEDVSDDETAPDSSPEDIDYTEVSDEVSDMLVQADELIAHEAPEPVVQPEPIDVPIPPPIEIPNETDAVDAEKESEAETEDADGDVSFETPDDSDNTEEDAEVDVPTKKSPLLWIRNILLVLLALALLAGGIYYYKNYYLQPIDAILLEESGEGELTVLVTSQINEDMLTVVCSDTYGNQLTSPVVDGKATFTGLAPNSAYAVKVIINGFHRLTGDTSAAYTTPTQTNIVQFTAVTGSEDGSVILGFTIDGPDANQWVITYQADDGEEKEVVFSGHVVTLNDLTVGSTYSFTLQPQDDLYITGTNNVTHTASKIVKANKVMITGCVNNTLTAAWIAPEGTNVESWTVRCYNDNGFDETIVTSQTNASFEVSDATAGYTVEVTAAGMSVSERAFAAANSTTVTNFMADDTDPNSLRLTWETASGQTEESWILLCSINGSAAQEFSCDTGNEVEIYPIIPGVEYAFTLQSADKGTVLGGYLAYAAPAAAAFEGYGVSAQYMEFMMCRTPSFSGWDRYDLSSSDYTTEFAVGEDASFLVRMRKEYSTSSDTIVTLFVICDENGTIVSTSTLSSTWTDMWYRNYCELDIPSIPNSSGNYTISVYFNGSLAGETDFTVVEA